MINAELAEKLNKFLSPWLFAHRGYSEEYPENTLVAFKEAALLSFVAMIELDVMLSFDGKVMVIHDEYLNRTTDGFGLVERHTLEQLKQLDAGGWFCRDFAGQRLPELHEVFELLRDFPVILNIEIKSSAHESHHPPDAIEAQVVDCIKKYGALNSALVSSFHTGILTRIANMVERPALALLSTTPANTDVALLCEDLDVFSWNPDLNILTFEQVELMRAAGISVIPYNVDTRKDFEMALAMGVNGVITNDPFIAKGSF